MGRHGTLLQSRIQHAFDALQMGMKQFLLLFNKFVYYTYLVSSNKFIYFITILFASFTNLFSNIFLKFLLTHYSIVVQHGLLLLLVLLLILQSLLLTLLLTACRRLGNEELVLLQLFVLVASILEPDFHLKTGSNNIDFFLAAFCARASVKLNSFVFAHPTT